MPRAAAKPKGMVRRAPVRRAAPRRRPVGSLRGHGDYTYDKPGPWGKAGRWVGNALGSHFAGQGGGKLGEKLGSYLHYIGKIFGSGDYVTSSMGVKSNTLVNSSQVPQFANSPHSMRIQHREYLGDIYSGTAGAFNIQNYPINPGMQQTFPWLSSVVGAQYQQYRIHGLVFEFRSMSADALNSTNTALGSVAMATDYDSTDVIFANKAQMENSQYGVSCKPSACMIHAIECAQNQKTLSEQYIRFADPPANADIRMYDLGRFSIATVGMQANDVNLGELWVSYDFEFLKPIQRAPLIDSEMAYFALTHTTASLAAAPLTLAADESANSDNIGLTLTGTTITFPPTMRPGTVLQVLHYVIGATTAGVIPPLAANTAHWSTFVPYIIPNVTTTTEQVVSITYVKYDGLGSLVDPPVITFGPMVAPGTITDAYLSVLQVNGDYI